MDLTNQTGLPALLVRSAIDDRRIAAAVTARLTYNIISNGRLRLSEEQPWIVSRPPWEGPRGPMPSDEVFYRGGVDLFVFGQAWTPRGQPAKTCLVRVSVGPHFASQILVFGDRIWSRRGGSLYPSDAEPFVSMPLTLVHAFGGKSTWDGLSIPHGSNPAGRGFAIDAAQATGLALPNFEDPDDLLRAWNDSPDPVGTGICPPSFGPRLRDAVKFDAKGVMTELSPRFFNAAFPKMVANSVDPGDSVTLEGVSPDGPIHFTLPPPPLATDLRVGGARMTRTLATDQIGVEPEARRVFITYRYPFRYTVLPRQTRSCILRLSEKH